MTLELASCEDLAKELSNRYVALVILGVHREEPTEITQVITGPAYMCAGLLLQTGLEVAASMQHPLE